MSTNKEFEILKKALESLKHSFNHDLTTPTNFEAISDVLQKVSTKMEDNYPYFDKKYIGQMLKPPHPIARLSYMLSMYINPNNHAMDGGRASSILEKEVIIEIEKMVGYKNSLGHLTSSGTIANMEALWIARKEHPNKIIAFSQMAHYTHERISEVLQISSKKIASDDEGKMDILALEKLLINHDIGTVVVTLGTTGTGSLDPLVKVIELQKTYKFRVHVDAAYGGYFILADKLNSDATNQFLELQKVDSLVIDPHKHGLQPYGCGCILFKDPKVARYYKHDSPYTYFSSKDLHLGEISLECSRAGASATALWATLQLLPLKKGGEFANGLNNCLVAAYFFSDLIKNDSKFILLLEPELDIVVWGKVEGCLSEMSKSSNNMFKELAKYGVHISLLKYQSDKLPNSWSFISKDVEEVTLMRCCFMKHDHIDSINQIWDNIQSVVSP